VAEGRRDRGKKGRGDPREGTIPRGGEKDEVKKGEKGRGSGRGRGNTWQRGYSVQEKWQMNSRKGKKGALTPDIGQPAQNLTKVYLVLRSNFMYTTATGREF
jgi:hypothetical protein